MDPEMVAIRVLDSTADQYVGWYVAAMRWIQEIWRSPGRFKADRLPTVVLM